MSILSYNHPNLIAAYTFPKCISGNVAVNMAKPNAANGKNPGQYNGLTRPDVSYIRQYAKPKIFNSGILYPTYKFQYGLSIYSDLSICVACIIQNKNTYDFNIGCNYTNGNPQAFNTLGINYSLISFATSTAQYTLKAGNSLGIGMNTVLITKKNTIVNLYLNGVLISKTTIVDNVFNPDNLLRTVSGNSIIKDVRIYNKSITEQEVKDYHNSFASKITLYEDFRNYAVGSTRFGNWKTSAINVSISENTIQTSTLTKGSKYISVNAVSTFASTPVNCSIGTTEFKLRISGLGTGLYSCIILGNSRKYTDSRSSGNYNLVFTCNTSGKIDTVQIAKGTTWYGGGGATFIGSPITINLTQGLFYDYKITRNSSGKFNLYINKILVLTITDNTYTSLQYFGIGLYGTKDLTNLKITQGITV